MCMWITVAVVVIVVTVFFCPSDSSGVSYIARIPIELRVHCARTHTHSAHVGKARYWHCLPYDIIAAACRRCCCCCCCRYYYSTWCFCYCFAFTCIVFRMCVRACITPKAESKFCESTETRNASIHLPTMNLVNCWFDARQHRVYTVHVGNFCSVFSSSAR